MNTHVRHPQMIALLSSTVLLLPLVRADAQEDRAAQGTAAHGGAAAQSAGPASEQATSAQSAPSTEPAKPKTIPISFNNAPMSQIAKFLSDQLGKPVVVNADVQKIKVTLVNTRPLPVDDAVYILRTALHECGVAVEEREWTVHLIPISQMVQRQLELVPAGVDLATIRPSNRIVRKVFDVKHYEATKLIEVLKPLMPSYGHLTADPTTGKLIAVATAERLITMSKIIGELDQADVSGRELRVFRIEHCDVYEIMPMLQKLIAGYLGVERKAPVSTAAPPSPRPPPGPPGVSQRPGGGPTPGRPGPAKPAEKAPAVLGVVSIEAEKRPVLLIPDPRRSSIVVEAPPHVLSQIERWLKQLDYPKPPSTQTEIVEVQYGDAESFCTQLTNMLNNHPDESLRSALRVFPFPSSRRLMLVGSEQNRAVAKEWLAEIDVEDTGLRVTQTFTLKYADAQQIAENIKEVFQDEPSGRFGYFYSFGRQQGPDRTRVTVTANVRNNSVTVLASPERMARIAAQIEEWDRPFEGEEAAPRVFTLTYADPEKAKELLESLFTEKEQSGVPWWWGDYESETPSPVGRLYGQFRFEAYPEMGKLIVVSKNEENYGVIERMIEQIDQAQLAGLPRIIELKFADAETLAEQLNALLNAPGTPTSILRRGQVGTFKDLADEGSPYSTRDQPQQRQPQQQQQQTELSEMRFWWQNPPPEIKAKQPSNLVGKLRIVPNVEQNLLMVAAPEEYVEAIERFVSDLDKPGYQVLIRAVIAEITHDDSTSLGFRFSTDPTVFTSGDPLITDDALRGLLTYTFEDPLDRRNTVSLEVNVNNLLSLLRRVTKLKIKSEPKILTADNVEGEFFDGQDIPFIADTQTTDVGSLTQGFDYFPVGITLRVRPHITKEATIDLMVNLRISSVIPGRTLFGGAIVDRRETTTRVVLENGKTFLISGILREEEREITRGIPGLCDIPLLGELFKHRELATVNSELLIFLTPYVIGPDYERDAIESEPLERLREQMMPEAELGDLQAPTTESDDQTRVSAAADTDTTARE